MTFFLEGQIAVAENGRLALVAMNRGFSRTPAKVIFCDLAARRVLGWTTVDAHIYSLVPIHGDTGSAFAIGVARLKRRLSRWEMNGKRKMGFLHRPFDERLLRVEWKDGSVSQKQIDAGQDCLCPEWVHAVGDSYEVAKGHIERSIEEEFAEKGLPYLPWSWRIRRLGNRTGGEHLIPSGKWHAADVTDSGKTLIATAKRAYDQNAEGVVEINLLTRKVRWLAEAVGGAVGWGEMRVHPSGDRMVVQTAWEGFETYSLRPVFQRIGVGQHTHDVPLLLGFVGDNVAWFALRKPIEVAFLRAKDEAEVARVPLSKPLTAISYTGGRVLVVEEEKLKSVEPSGKTELCDLSPILTTPMQQRWRRLRKRFSSFVLRRSTSV